MTDRLWFTFAVWLSMMVAGLLHLGIVWFVLQRTGVGVTEFKIFAGRPGLRVKLGTTDLVLGWIPSMISLKWDEYNFPNAPWRVRVGAGLLGIVAVATAALCLLGWTPWTDQMTKSFRQFLEGAIHPISVGAPLLERFRTADLPWKTFIGVLWAKYAVYHLFPIPQLTAGNLWAEALRHRKERLLEWIQTIGALTIIAFSICWLIAWGWFWLGP